MRNSHVQISAVGATNSRRKGARIIFIIAACILVVALGALAFIFYTYVQGEKEYSELAAENVEIPAETNSPSLASFNIDWGALRAINSDVVGWIYVPGTEINYPVMWREGDDQYYMTHSFGGTTNPRLGANYGAIGLSKTNNPDWTDQLNFLSGHHMFNGTMFTKLFYFQQQETFDAHRTFYLLTPKGNFKLTSFAVDKILGSSPDIVVPNFATEKELQDYLQERINTSKVDVDSAFLDVTKIKQAFAFYTCSEPDSYYRIMVYCKVDEFLPEGASASKQNALVDEADIASVETATRETTS